MISSSKDHERLTGRGNVDTIVPSLDHQIFPKRRFFAQIVGTVEPPVEERLCPDDKHRSQAQLEQYAGAARGRLPKLKQAPTGG